MQRTQIYLSKQQLDRLKQLALKEHSSTSEVIRKLLSEKLADINKNDPKKSQRHNPGKWLLDQAKWAEKNNPIGPPDLATNMDEYIYGDKK